MDYTMTDCSRQVHYAKRNLRSGRFAPSALPRSRARGHEGIIIQFLRYNSEDVLKHGYHYYIALRDVSL